MAILIYLEELRTVRQALQGSWYAAEANNLRQPSNGFAARRSVQQQDVSGGRGIRVTKGARRAEMRARFLAFFCCGFSSVAELVADASTGSCSSFGKVEVCSVIAFTGSRAYVSVLVTSTGSGACGSMLSLASKFCAMCSTEPAATTELAEVEEATTGILVAVTAGAELEADSSWSY